MGLLAIILIAFALVIYTLQERSALGEVDAELQTYAKTTVSLASRDVIIKHINGSAPNLVSRSDAASSFAGTQLYVQFTNLWGVIGTQEPRLRDTSIPLDNEMRDWANRGRPSKRSVPLASGTLLRVYTEPVILDNQVIGYIQTARVINSVSDNLSRLATLLTVGIVLALIGFALWPASTREPRGAHADEAPGAHTAEITS